jgi:hypothetical protein
MCDHLISILLHRAFSNFLHFLLSAPYEEILQDVYCPAELLKDLKAMWMVCASSYITQTLPWTGKVTRMCTS